jgi:hypothetical protein
LAEFVRARDQVCVFPGCRRSAWRCELDHRTRYPQGPTSADNLDSKCPHHHQAKDHPDWYYEPLDNGGHLWITPAGRCYIATPEPMTEPVSRPKVVNPEDPDPPPF